MKSILKHALIAFSLAFPLFAFGQKISADPTATTLGGGEYLAGVQTGANVKVLPSQILTYVLANVHSVNAQTGTTYTYVTGDRGKLVSHSNASAIAGTLPQATSTFGAGWFMLVQNRGAGTLTITPTTSTIDGASTLVLSSGNGAFILSDGTNYYTMRTTSTGGTPAGSSTYVQYNASGSFGAEAAFAYDASTNTLTVDNVTTAGRVLTAASTTAGSGLRLPHGAAPTSPVDGDVWTTSAGGMYARINGATVGPFSAGGTFTGGTLTSALNEAPTVTLASSGTVNIGAASANSIDISGTTTITAFDTIAAGAVRVLKFSGALTLTHNGTTLALPGAGNITTANGDYAAFQSRGGGNWYCIWYQRASGAPVVSSGSSLSNFSEAINTSSPNATTPIASLTASNAATNVDFAIVPKGNGAIVARIADSGTTNGNKRGTNAVDLQRDLNADAAAVAAGTASAIVGGVGNKTASSAGGAFIGAGQSINISGGSQVGSLAGRGITLSGNYSASVGGFTNTNSGTYSVLVGGTNGSITGNQAVLLSGDGVVLDADYGLGAGYRTSQRGMKGAFVRNSGAPSTFQQGGRQMRTATLQADSTSATAVNLTTDAAAAGTSNQFVLPSNSALALTGSCVLRNTSTSTAGVFTFSAVWKNVAGTVTMPGSTVSAYVGDAALNAVTLTAQADNTNKAAQLAFAGLASNNISVVCEATSVEVVN